VAARSEELAFPGVGGSTVGTLPPPRAAVTTQAASITTDLTSFLRRTFGFTSFLPNQEPVCKAVIEGRDVLLVMPTGSGKSLCYQLPAIARGGSSLVISPLIALMEDQVAKLRKRGFAVDRIHSGRARTASRQVCRDYLAGKLQFLFIAPERLRVTGFPEMLAKRPLSLIVVDEAHCISQWGHDFRPDYRRLGQYVPTLRPAPVIALTATATPPVQKDILEQLGLIRPQCFIHGFRRSNIAIEVVEAPPSERFSRTEELLSTPERRPAIVYVPTRREAESVAGALAVKFTAAAYHAGLDSDRRHEVQEAFLAGKLEVVVATIAFGMGIDKSDIRTVIHTALPGSVEAYYQEIGRAGRDGKPSRAVLMHSYADRHKHDFFLERDYPEVGLLNKIFAALGPAAQPKQVLQEKLSMELEVFDKALEKLWTHGGAAVDFAENVSRGQDDWRDSYLLQIEQKRLQIEQMIRYAEGHECRMAALVRHFGDLADSQKPCGICDHCAPAACTAQRFRTVTRAEQDALWKIVAELSAGGARGTGRLYNELCPAHEMSRDDFESLLGAMMRAHLVRLEDASFEKEGRLIPYRTVRLTRTSSTMSEAAIRELMVRDREPAAAPRKRRRKGSAAAASLPAQPAVRPAQRERSVKISTRVEAENDARIGEALRAWRLSEARRLGVPAFRIFSDRTLQALVSQRPDSTLELLQIPGIGLRTAERYGDSIRRILYGGREQQKP